MHGVNEMLIWQKATDEISDRISKRSGFFNYNSFKNPRRILPAEKMDRSPSAERGPENVIAADNRSTDHEVLSIYEEYSPDLLVFQSEGFHNFVHDKDRMGKRPKSGSDGRKFWRVPVA